MELTICYETNYVDAHERKEMKNLGLAEEIEERGYHAVIILVQVGSRGMVEVEGFERLQLYLTTTSERQWRSLLIAITKETIEMSHTVWAERNWEI